MGSTNEIKSADPQRTTGFLLTRQWRDTQDGVELDYWFASEAGPVRARVQSERSVFFLRESELADARPVLAAERGHNVRSLKLRAFDMAPVAGLYFPSHKQARNCADRLRDRGLDPLEADINPADRYLMERFVAGGAELVGTLHAEGSHQSLHHPRLRAMDHRPELTVASVDIETAMEGVQLYSIGVHLWGPRTQERIVFMVGEGADQEWVQAVPSQRAALEAFLDWLATADPDVLIGWNVINFDLWYLQRVADAEGMKLTMGRAGTTVHWRSLDDDGERRTLQLPGRVVLDGIELLRAAFYRFESFSLENVAREILGEGKLLHGSDRGGEITDLFLADKTRLAQYNLKDCELVSDIFHATGLLDFAIARSAMTGLNMDRLGGSVASFDNLYLPRLHREGYVAPNAPAESPDSPGGFVLDSRPGIYDHVLVLDFKSLYPSIIRSFHIDPLGLALGVSGELEEAQTLPGFRGGLFAREGHILPDLIATLWHQRDTAKANQDEALSQAIKIIMNSFYGVLGSPGCRFFDTRLASSITLRGHQILQDTRDYIERAGHRVIYGDTDSVFVWIHEAADDEGALAAGRDLEQSLNRWWCDRLQQEFGVNSALELEFETHYQRFLMPTVRGSEKGSKKRYAGLVASAEGPAMVFKGLENVRTDWTRLAREFQEELYRRVFLNEPFEDFVRETVASVLAGERDEQMIYRKRLRRKLDDYEKNVPPHVQAARLCESRGLKVPRRGSWVEYVVTTSGAEPAQATLAPLDYQYYIDRQLQPVADGILGFAGTSFRALVDQQFALF